MILDDHTPEGRTLKQFCNNFAVLEKNPATLVMNVRTLASYRIAVFTRTHLCACVRVRGVRACVCVCVCAVALMVVFRLCAGTSIHGRHARLHRREAR
jgi:hypothetical protein